jgi:hypothetical protein
MVKLVFLKNPGRKVHQKKALDPPEKRAQELVSLIGKSKALKLAEHQMLKNFESWQEVYKFIKSSDAK